MYQLIKRDLQSKEVLSESKDLEGALDSLWTMTCAYCSWPNMYSFRYNQTSITRVTFPILVQIHYYKRTLDLKTRKYVMEIIPLFILEVEYA